MLTINVVKIFFKKFQHYLAFLYQINSMFYIYKYNIRLDILVSNIIYYINIQ